LINLNMVYGSELSERERRGMARQVFLHFGKVAAEFLKISAMSREEVDSYTESVQGEEHLQAALAAGKGVILITGHLGNWEFLSRWLSAHGYQLTVVARRANDPEAERLLSRTRSESGATVLSRGNAARQLLQTLKNNEIVALLPDQNASDVVVPFFGVPTGTVDGPALIHLKTGAPLLFAWCTRMPQDRFRIIMERPEVVPSTGNREADCCAVMALINSRLEAQIRRSPAQWLWLHNRWKSSEPFWRLPDGEAPAKSGAAAGESAETVIVE
ncbi:MAG TPA: lysophospholipid acyltransferase family protein, partial [Chthonomonadales bacterium]|nr:lysophospholipid acyltransferase family protein [Chthonomonadales bacterium]